MLKLTKVLFFGALIARETFALWPVIDNEQYGTKHISFTTDHITINSGLNNDILTRAINRYTDLIKTETYTPILDFNVGRLATTNVNANLQINVSNQSSDLNLDTSEEYTLSVNSDGTAKLDAQTIYGAIRGLETFSQLVEFNAGRRVIKNTPIVLKDKPNFQHRGLLLDTSRNFYPVSSLKRIIDGMAYTKLNVFTWHLLDSYSWSVESKNDPNLHIKGSYGPGKVYMYTDVIEIINYAKDRGIRVIPEFNMPGRSFSVGLSNPDLVSCFTQVPKTDKILAGYPSGQLNIAKSQSQDFARSVISEYSKLFPDNYFNVGGNALQLGCYNSDPDVIQALKQNSTETVLTLLQKFYGSAYDQAKKEGKTPIFWEDALLAHSYSVPKDAVIKAGKNDAQFIQILQQGYKVIATPLKAFTLDCGKGNFVSNSNINDVGECGPYKMWNTMYNYDPYFNLPNISLRDQIIGGEVNMFSQQADNSNIDRFLWPRLAAAAEVLWAGPYTPGTTTRRPFNPASARLNDFRERLLQRGIKSMPLMPLWCARNPYMCVLPPTSIPTTLF
ncbi:Beta-hexosaminidase 2 [Smittium culicis]|uniref:Beta-hexosaminidase n=1 Tax=Smittium culicis TaxID=133412 RepID=A0A1R1X807_9FUNG|nr:Beta-hexosaminidase 2 [Smittium culicis]